MDEKFVKFKLYLIRHWRLYAGIGVGLLAAIILMLVLAKRAKAPEQKPVVKQTQVKTEAAKPALDPLTIEAMRARSYTASPIITEQLLGNQGGYTNAVVSYQSDGNKIYALQSTPAGTAPVGGWPVIIFDHGYINPATYKTNDGAYQGFIASLTRAGFVVIKPDYRGHGSSQGSPDGGHFSPVYAYDNLNLIASLKQYPLVNKDRIGLFGHSLGGHVALRTIVISKDVKATVFMAGVVGSIYDLLYNWPNSPMAGDMPTTLVTGKKQALIDKYGDPKANLTFWDSVSAINYVDFISGKVQVNHDVGDSTVPVFFSQRLVEALHKAGKPVDYYTYPGDDHQFAANRSAILQHMIDFYKANL